MEKGLFLHLPPSIRDQYDLNLPQDLFRQAQKVAYKPFISRLPPKDREEFIAELNLHVLEKWTSKPFDYRQGSFSNWLWHRARQAATSYFRVRGRKISRELQMFDRGSYYDNDNRRQMISEDWLWAHVQSDAVYQQTNPLQELSGDGREALLDVIGQYIPMTDIEKDVLSFKLSRCSLPEISEVMDLDLLEIRKISKVVSAKVEAAKAIANIRMKPVDSVSISASGQPSSATFPSAVFDVSIERLGPCGSYSGVDGVHRVAELTAGASAIGKKCRIVVTLETCAKMNATIIRNDYGRVIRHCSGLKVNSKRIEGTLPKDQPGADLVWALMLGDACNRKKLRSTAAFDPTVHDFRLIAANMRTMGVADDPVFSTAVRCWEARLNDQAVGPQVR